MVMIMIIANDQKRNEAKMNANVGAIKDFYLVYIKWPRCSNHQCMAIGRGKQQQKKLSSYMNILDNLYTNTT